MIRGRVNGCTLQREGEEVSGMGGSMRKATPKVYGTGSLSREPSSHQLMNQPQPAVALYVVVLPQAERHLPQFLAHLLLHDLLQHHVTLPGSTVPVHQCRWHRLALTLPVRMWSVCA